MSLFWIKIIAAASMLIDHLGVFLFPQYIVFRVVGRLAFPLFAWGIANGAHHTKNIKNYLLRLFVFALISQIPYQLLLHSYGVRGIELNILFTFSLSLSFLVLIKNLKYTFQKILLTISVLILTYLLKLDYQYLGIIGVWLFYYFYNNKRKTIFLFSLLTLIFSFAPLILDKKLHGQLGISYMNIIQPISLISLMVIAMYNGKTGKNMKYFFYLFYPVHLMLLYLVGILLL